MFITFTYQYVNTMSADKPNEEGSNCSYHQPTIFKSHRHSENPTAQRAFQQMDEGAHIPINHKLFRFYYVTI